MYEAYNLNCCSGAKKILPQVYFSECSLELHFYYALEVISILSLIAGSNRPNSILGSVDFNISHEFYRQKNNSKIEPNTVFEDMLERITHYSTKQGMRKIYRLITDKIVL